MKSLVAYITAGFPDINFTVDLSLALKEVGVDKLELGIPFSDPVADGPIIEIANLKALQSGFKMSHLFEVSRQIAPKIDTFWMGYFNAFYHQGVDFFTKTASECGVKGFIIPDLPYEETLLHLPTINSYGIDLVSFVAPTHSKERIAKVVKDAKGFIYLVAYAGITGAKNSEDLSQIIQYVKEQSNTPLFVGFGVNEKTAKERVRGADGVIVGSAFVEVLLDESLSNAQKISSICHKAKVIKDKINS